MLKGAKVFNQQVREKNYTSVRAVAYVSALSCPDTVRNAGFPKKSCQQEIKEKNILTHFTIKPKTKKKDSVADR